LLTKASWSDKPANFTELRAETAAAAQRKGIGCLFERQRSEQNFWPAKTARGIESCKRLENQHLQLFPESFSGKGSEWHARCFIGTNVSQ
jgi:hypothetical protein